MILNRARRLLSRLRRPAVEAPPPAAPPPPAPPPAAPPPAWREELNTAGLTADEWVAKRLASDSLYINVSQSRLQRLRETHPHFVDATQRAAERVLRHEFDLLGSGPYQPRDPDRAAHADGYQPIDWYLDPIARLRFSPGVRIECWNFQRMRPGNADIKLPWELARCQHWPLLGQAYQLTGDDRFALEIARELDDFMEANPIGTAVNWACTMDVAIRAANWALGLELVRSCSALDQAFWHRAYEALFDHGTFIEGHLENHYEVTSNHFLSNIVGLFFVAALFDDLPIGRQWDASCRTWLDQEMRVQVLSDGADYESSVAYHRLVAELFLGSARLAEYKQAPLPPDFMARLRHMFDFLEGVLRPDGLMPQVGDADDGRLHILSGYGDWQPQDGRHVFGPAGFLFDDPAWRSIDGERAGWESAWWGFDAEPSAAAPHVDRALRHFPGAGLTVMRRGRDYLLITNGIVGTAGFGNHKHNDQLGFELHVDGRPIVVDPGSYVYTSDAIARNLFRSTSSHNTLAIDGTEQNQFATDGLFRTFEKSHPEHVEVAEHHDRLIYRGRHRAYTRLVEPVVHERSFTWARPSGALTIVDVLEGRGTHRVRWHFHFAPGVLVSPTEPGSFAIRSGDVSVQLTAPPALTATVGDGWYSPSYGVRAPCRTLDFEAEVSVGGSSTYRFHFTS